MKVRYKKFEGSTEKKKSGAPLTLHWKNARMVRSHSLQAVARDIINVNRSIEVVKINVIGNPSTGKTTLLKSLGHLIHTLSDEPYAVKILKREDLLNMEETLANLEPVNHYLGFDDVSWLAAGNTKAKLDQVQKTFTEIRHLKGGQDVKVIIGFNFHYNLSIPKHLRQADFFIYTSLGSSELENTQKIVGMKNNGKLLDFRRIFQEAITTGKPATPTKPEEPATFSYRLPGKANLKFTYRYRQPFAPALFWDNATLHHIVFPSREWIDPICSVCSGSVEKTEKEKMDVQRFKKEALYKFGSGTFRSALRIKLMQMGIYTWNPRVKQAMAWIDKYMEHRLFNFDDLIKEFDLKDNRTRRTQSLPKDILES